MGTPEEIPLIYLVQPSLDLTTLNYKKYLNLALNSALDINSSKFIKFGTFWILGPLGTHPHTYVRPQLIMFFGTQNAIFELEKREKLGAMLSIHNSIRKHAKIY